MAERILEHPILTYVTFVLPAILLVLGIIFGANVFLMIVTIAWLASAFVVIYLPLSQDDGSST